MTSFNVIEPAWARAFAEEWIDAWNSHDMDRILAHYRDDFEMASPLIIERGLAPGGVLKGKPAVAAYWRQALADAQPPIRFELVDVYAGVDTIVVYASNVGRRLFMEVLTFDTERRVIRGAACWETKG